MLLYTWRRLLSCLQHEMVLSAISALLVDDNSHFTWPLGHNMWYYGHSLYITKGFPFLPARIVQSLSQAWHSCFIHLVGCIWGQVQRCGAYSCWWHHIYTFHPSFFLLFLFFVFQPRLLPNWWGEAQVLLVACCKNQLSNDMIMIMELIM